MFYKLIVATVSVFVLPVHRQFKLFDEKETSDCFSFVLEIIYLME
jgi:hypothetical protein